ncbi:hypothetical protein FRX31_014965, partial [Thalictrum thalictroides]
SRKGKEVVPEKKKQVRGNENVEGSGSVRGKKNARMRVFDPVAIIPLAMRPKSAIFKKYTPSRAENHWCKGGDANCTCWEMWIKYDSQRDGGHSSSGVASPYTFSPA